MTIEEVKNELRLFGFSEEQIEAVADELNNCSVENVEIETEIYKAEVIRK